MALKLQEFNEILHKAVPFKDTWMKEAYGPYNTKLNTSRQVARALYCVTPTAKVVDQFKKGGYDILLSHHPYIVGVPQWIAHTALDCTTGGLNDQWRDLFNLKNTKHFDGKLGWYGELDRPHTLQELIAKSEQFVGAPLIGEHHGHEHPINSIVICTGLGGMVEKEAHATGADCYVLGEATKHKDDSNFKARIETGHTLSEHGTGLNFFRKHLEPHGIIVDPSDLEHDKYSGEVYRQPTYHKYFSERGLPRPTMGSRPSTPGSGTDWRRPAATYVPQKGTPAGHLWDENEDEFVYDPSFESGAAYQPIGDDDEWMNEPKFWEKPDAPPSDKPPTSNERYLPQLRRPDTSQQGVNSTPKIVKPPGKPGGDFGEDHDK
jgi:putative NIF3 family GTP cyclohydrolase 1 type 2